MSTKLGEVHCYFALGYNDEAIQWEQGAIELAPQWSGPYYVVGIAYWRKGQLEEARKYLGKSCELGFKGACEQMNQIPKSR